MTSVKFLLAIVIVDVPVQFFTGPTTAWRVEAALISIAYQANKHKAAVMLAAREAVTRLKQHKRNKEATLYDQLHRIPS